MYVIALVMLCHILREKMSFAALNDATQCYRVTKLELECQDK